MKKLLILLTCIGGIGMIAPTTAKAWDGCRPQIQVYRDSCGYPVYRPRCYDNDAYSSYPVRVRHYENSYREENEYYRPRCESYRPRVRFSFLFMP